MRRLTQKEARILAEIADRLLKELLDRDVIGVENDDDLAVGLGQGVVHVAGLGVFVALARDVTRPQILRQRREIGAALLRLSRFGGVGLRAFLVGAAVVEDVDAKFIGGVIHLDGRQDGHREQFRIFVVGGDEDVDAWRLLVGEGGRGLAIQRVRDDEQADRQHRHGINLGDIEKHAGDEIERVADRRHGVRRAPKKVAHHHRAAEREKDLTPNALEIQRAD